MVRAYLVGVRAALRRWPLVLILWLIVAAFGFTFALTSGIWLRDALDGSLATRTLFRTLDPDVFVDLWYHHYEGLRGVAAMALVLAGLHTILWWWLHGVVIAALQQPEPRGTWTRGLELAPRMAQLFAIALSVLALFTGAIGGPAYLLVRWTRSSPSAMIWYEIGGVGAALWLIGYVFLVAVHDHARLRAGRTDDHAFACYRWALGFVLRGRERAFLLACALQLSALAVWLAYQVVGLTFPMSAILGLTGSLLWGQAFLLVRQWVRVWFFAAQDQLQA
jgi:hypothetical protein